MSSNPNQSANPAQQSQTGSGGGSGKHSRNDPPPPADEPEPGKEHLAAETRLAGASARKAVDDAALDIYSDAPDKAKSRSQIEADYRAAARRPSDGEDGGELYRRYHDEVDKNFRSVAEELAEGEASRLEIWIQRRLADPDADKASILPRLRLKGLLDTRLSDMKGYRHPASLIAQQEASRLEAAHKSWAAPHVEIKKLIDSYAKELLDMVSQVSIDRKQDRDWTIYRFWFQIAPKHLQLRWYPVDDANAPGRDMLVRAFSEAKVPELAERLKSAEERKDCSLYLISPDKLPEKRKEVFAAWRDAVEASANAAAAYRLRPDDPTKLIERSKALLAGESDAVKPALTEA